MAMVIVTDGVPDSPEAALAAVDEARPVQADQFVEFTWIAVSDIAVHP